MTEEQRIESELLSVFGNLAGKVRIQRARRLWVEADYPQFRPVFDHLVRNMGFNILCTITGCDEGQTLSALYHLARPSGVVVNLRTRVPKDAPVLATVTDAFPAAEVPEREMVDLLGMQVQGLGPGNRYPLPDGWPAGQYPLRKDWKPEMLKGTEFAKEDRQ